MRKPGERHKYLLDIFTNRNIFLNRCLRNVQGILANQIFVLLWRIILPGVQRSTCAGRQESVSGLHTPKAAFAPMPEKELRWAWSRGKMKG